MSTKQEIVSDAAFKAWPFSSDFNFACKDGRVITATHIYYCPLVISPTITNCCKELHLKFGWIPSSVLWKRCHAQKLVRFGVKTSLFSYSFKMLQLYRQSFCFSLLLFTVWWSIFDQPFKWLLWIQSTIQSQNYLRKSEFL